MTPAPATGRRDTNPVMGDTMDIHPSQISAPPWAVLGYRKDGRPIRSIAGGAEADDDTDVVVDDPEPVPDPEPEPQDDPEPEPDDPPKPKAPAKKAAPKPGDDDYVPSAEEWRRTQAALKKANDEAKTHRLRARELEDKGRADESDHDKALRLAREEGEARFREPMKKAGVKTALVEAGFVGPDRLMRLVDWDAVTVEDDGGLIGVEGELSRLKAEFPEFLEQDKPKPKVRPTGAPRPAAEPVKKTSAQIHADKALGRS